MKAATTFLKFATYSTLTALFAVSTMQVGTQLTAELTAVALKLRK